MSIDSILLKQYKSKLDSAISKLEREIYEEYTIESDFLSEREHELNTLYREKEDLEVWLSMVESGSLEN